MRIVIVDDNDDLRGLFGELCSRDGHEVVLCKDGTEGLEQFAATTADLVITDLEMPAMSGVDLVRKLRELGHACPAILVTGKAHRAFSQCELDSITDLFEVYLPKPVSPKALRSAVANVAQRASLHQKVGAALGPI